MEEISDNTWILVQRKKTKNNKKISGIYSENLRPIEEKDYTLSEKETKIVLNSKIETCCFCCGSDVIQNVIKRPFTSCGICYCCVGDDPAFDMPDLCIFVNDSLDRKVVFWDPNCSYKYYKNQM